MKQVLITGGSGLVGRKITALLESKGHTVAWLSRDPKRNKQLSFAWDVEKQFIDPKAIAWADAIIHLAGEGVAEKRWTAERKSAILTSRTASTALLLEAIRISPKVPKAFVSASAVGYYGFDTHDAWVDENSESGGDFLASVVKAWENSVQQIASQGLRTVLLRIGIVLDKDGGALKEMMKPPVTAPLGTGRQWMSWIHIEDLAGMFLWALENEKASGIYNAVGPNPATNASLTKVAAKFAGKPYVGIGVPAFGLKLALGEMAQMVLGGNKITSKKIQEAGFKFKYPELEGALREVYK
ncbi:Cell division inhibitor [Mariniradius saccharolyticus AK6]|uniref:Cell division inhibitor n=1 Tax=Mariniradius saccharolyticus AK6 TaxID=1239962 RepID=M7X126_9BACT|nr:TIGR01777 family oxidoreductase [Mariniradius saccharolyticus]EMS31225.1 Cell division inhibitor [Mariniradius saccharolyticus AK6]